MFEFWTDWNGFSQRRDDLSSAIWKTTSFISPQEFRQFVRQKAATIQDDRRAKAAASIADAELNRIMANVKGKA